MTQALLILAALGLLWSLARSLRSARKASLALARARRGYFDALSPRLTRVMPSGFARASLTRHGLRFDLQLIPDALAIRKLPCLWLMITLTEAQNRRTETRIMARASGLEPFSHFADLSHEAALPPGFPPDCTARSTEPTLIPATLAPLMADPRAKELTLSPQGLRLVVLAEEAPRSAYLLFREAQFPNLPPDTARIEALMTTLSQWHESPR
ncbi:hypothetical protein NX862_18050 [Rhodobacter sp. KR11]|uniref:hypothetical protein n=1 Tax=Rhodobacter sp. KR11 TaxID=2974588 RepID=UPI0022218A5B|nr:hypothetical protein [Rhodobacter sp. KR11]MCW1920663.1 hypothetical protein [Rhodobacter sp. KR11]